MSNTTRTRATFSIRSGIASALAAEAARTDTTPSRVLEAVLLKYLPLHLSEEVSKSLQADRKDIINE